MCLVCRYILKGYCTGFQTALKSVKLTDIYLKEWGKLHENLKAKTDIKHFSFNELKICKDCHDVV